jgi:hypothetical protein
MQMKTTFSILCVSAFSIALFAFTTAPTSAEHFAASNDADTAKAAKKEASKPKAEYITSIGGCTSNVGGSFKKEAFLALLNNALCAKDNKTNQTYPVANFDITYGERVMTEDSTGYSHIDVDYQSENIEGDKVPEKWKKHFAEMLYKGDTVKFENIRVRTSTGKYRSKNQVVVVIVE